MPSTPTKGGPSTIARRQHHHHHHLDSGGGGAACSAADDGKGHAEEADHHRHQLTVAVRLFIRQALHLPHSDSVHTAGGAFDFYGGTFSKAEVCGLVTSIDPRAKYTAVTVDDGTGSLPCLLWYEGMAAGNAGHRWGAVDENGLSMPPPLAFSIGDVVVVRGRLSAYHDSRQLSISAIYRLADVLQEAHWIGKTLYLHKRVYSRGAAGPRCGDRVAPALAPATPRKGEAALNEESDGRVVKRPSSWVRYEGVLPPLFDCFSIRSTLAAFDPKTKFDDDRILSMVAAWIKAGLVCQRPDGAIVRLPEGSLDETIAAVVKVHGGRADVHSAFVCSHLRSRGYSISPEYVSTALARACIGNGDDEGRIHQAESGLFRYVFTTEKRAKV